MVFTRQTKVGKLVLADMLANMLANCWQQIELVSICCQQFANIFANCCCGAFHACQLKFANTNLPTLVCRVKAALNVGCESKASMSQLVNMQRSK